MPFSPESTELTLLKMRARVVQALRDERVQEGPLKTQASLRALAYATASADLAGTSQELEFQRARGEVDDSNWVLSSR